MRIRSRIRGPKLGAKLALLGTALLVVPWFSYLLLKEMEQLLVRMQSHQQQLTAESISTSFNGRGDLFTDLPLDPAEYEALYARPIQASVRLDGRATDWGNEQVRKPLRFGGDGDGSFELSLGQRDDYLYAYLDIVDDAPVYRAAEFLRLDNADHVRINFIGPDGDEVRLVVLASRPGVTTAYVMQEDWRYALTGAPQNEVQGYLRKTDAGFALELRLPLAMLGSRRYFGLSFADVDDATGRAIARVTQTLPSADKAAFDLVVFRSPELLDIIEGLGYSGARILVIDAQKRIRAETGSYRSEQAEPTEPTWVEQSQGLLRGVGQALDIPGEWVRETFFDTQGRAGETPDDAANAVIVQALAGNPIALRRRINDTEEVIFAGHPIRDDDMVIGMIAVEQNIDEILRFQRTAIDKLVLFSVLSFLAGFIALIAFSGRLAWRIRRLRREATAAIDEHGRLITDALTSETTSGDEIGDLARSISGMLMRLRQHNTFLETMPRTLRHEINNPLNTLSTSLQHLEDKAREAGNEKYLESAQRGVMRIGTIVQNLADAANLEESLSAEDMSVIDIGELIESYVNNCRTVHGEHRFVYHGPGVPVYARASDFRIEQMLDKLIDNAIDFHRANSPIKVRLDIDRMGESLRISIANRGPTLPPDAAKFLFESMVSRRGPGNNLHFGIGLYVVRVIVDHHGGSVRAMNLVDGSGVVFRIWLPLAKSLRDEVAAEPPAAVATEAANG